MKDTTWKELFPEGRFIFYEGDDPAGFVEQVKREFGFDPTKDEHWGKKVDHRPMRGFWCPADLLDAIYGNERFPMGS